MPILRQQTSALDKVIVGNIAIQARSLRRFLKKSHYWLKYDPKRETAELWANHGGGGEMLLELRNCSYESAVRLAEELGLEAHGGTEQPLTRSKWNPVVTLYSDGSLTAQMLHREAVALGLPTVVVTARECGISSGQGLYNYGMFALDRLIDLLREWPAQYREQLDTEA